MIAGVLVLAGAIATGRFDIDTSPATAPDATIAALILHKTFHGDLSATGVGEMLASGDPASGTAAYVAMERVTGTLAGRQGAFTLQHQGSMGGGATHLSVSVVPGSGTGALAGIIGTMEIDAAHGHAYTFRYTLPGR